MPNKSKAKGNAGELKIAKFLSEVYEQQFIRVPNSGAYTGGSNAYRRNNMDQNQRATFDADLIPPSNMRKLVIESKFYKSFPFENLLKSSAIPLLDGWIRQAKSSADEDKVWLLIFRINHKGSFVVFDEMHLNLFKPTNHSIFITRPIDDSRCNHNRLVITEFEPFIKNNKDVIFDLVNT